MATTSHPEFNENTEGVEVTKAFADDVHGKTFLITGVNLGGLGFSAAEALASQSPANLILAGRNPLKIQQSIDALESKYPTTNYHILQIDLSSQSSVRTAAAELLSWSSIPTIDILINNAGVMMIPERTITDDGIEKHFATNHIGHFLFTNLIMPKLIAASANSSKGATRIVNVSSGSPSVASMRWSDINFSKRNNTLPVAEQPSYWMHKLWGTENPEEMSYIPLEGYNQSKVANVLFGIGLTHRLFEKYGILSTAVHPGVIKTELGRDATPETMKAIQAMMDKGVFTYKSFGAGSATTLVAALDPKVAAEVGEMKDGKDNFGAFLMDCQISDKASALAVDSGEAEKLWKLSQKLVKEEFVW